MKVLNLTPGYMDSESIILYIINNFFYLAGKNVANVWSRQYGPDPKPNKII